MTDDLLLEQVRMYAHDQHSLQVNGDLVGQLLPRLALAESVTKQP